MNVINVVYYKISGTNKITCIVSKELPPFEELFCVEL